MTVSAAAQPQRLWDGESWQPVVLLLVLRYARKKYRKLVQPGIIMETGEGEGDEAIP